MEDDDVDVDEERIELQPGHELPLIDLLLTAELCSRVGIGKAEVEASGPILHYTFHAMTAVYTPRHSAGTELEASTAVIVNADR